MYITSYSGIKNVCPLECNVFPHCLNLILDKQSSKYKPGPIKLHKSSSDSHFMTREEELCNPVQSKQVVQPHVLDISLNMSQ